MAVVWKPDFLWKHIVVVRETMSFTEMVKTGIGKYNERMGERMKAPLRRGLEAGGNTFVVISPSGFEQMTSWVEGHGVHGASAGVNWVPVEAGAIIRAKGTVGEAMLGAGGGEIHLQIIVAGEIKTVDHLQSLNGDGGCRVRGTELTGSQVTERQQLLRGLLGAQPVMGEGREQHTTEDKIIKIVDSFLIGHL